MKHLAFAARIFSLAHDRFNAFLTAHTRGLRACVPAALIIFSCALVYLHQKVNVYVSACQLSDNYSYYEELAAKRDYLTYVFNKEMSLPKINQWVDKNNFSFNGRSREIAMNLRKDKPKAGGALAAAFGRVMNIPAAVGTAMAHDNE